MGTRISPLASVVLDGGKITFITKVIINEIEFTSANGLISLNIRKELSLENRITANDFDLYLQDIPQESIFYNPGNPTHPSIMNPGSPIQIYVGYARYKGSGLKSDLDNFFIQWFKVIEGTTGTYTYDSKNRTLSIGCLDRVEELSNKGDWISPAFEYMTPVDLLRIISNDPKVPPVGERNLFNNGFFEQYGENARFPKFWSGTVFDKGGFTRFKSADAVLPKGWRISDSSKSSKFRVTLKEYDNYNAIHPHHKFNDRNNVVVNFKDWKDANKDGLADWWNTTSITGHYISPKTSNDSTRIQVLNGSVNGDGIFYQTVPSGRLDESSSISCFGTIKGTFRLYLSNGDYTTEGTIKQHADYSSFLDNISLPIDADGFTQADPVYIGIIPIGTVYIQNLYFDKLTNLNAPKGFSVSGDVYNDNGLSHVSFNTNDKTFKWHTGDGKLYSPVFKDEITYSGDSLKHKSYTVDLLYRNPQQVETEDTSEPLTPHFKHKTVFSTTCGITTTGENTIPESSAWAYYSFTVPTGGYSFSDGLTYGLITGAQTVIDYLNYSGNPVYIQEYRVFPNEWLGNPCFYDSNSDGVPDNYSLVRSSNKITSEVDSLRYLEMGSSVRLRSEDKAGFGALRARLTDLPNGFYTLFGNYSCEDLNTAGGFNQGCYAQVSAYDSDDCNTWAITSPSISGFQDWLGFSMTFYKNSGDATIDIMLNTRGAKGDCRFNDCKLIKNSVFLRQREGVPEYQVVISKTAEEELSNDEFYAVGNIPDFKNLMHSGNNLTNIKTLRMNGKVGSDFTHRFASQNHLIDPYFEHGTDEILDPIGYTVVVEDEDEAILKRRCVKLTKD